MLAALTPLSATPPPPTRLSSLLRSVPLARSSVSYYSSFVETGEFDYDAPLSTPTTAFRSTLELSAGKRCTWSRAYLLRTEYKPRMIAADWPAAPESPPAGVECVAADNTRLGTLADFYSDQQFDLVFGGHCVCTCTWLLNPIDFTRAWIDRGETRYARACTCGGVPLDRLGVDSFVAGLDALLTPDRGVAILDMEGGWPFGLETYLRESAQARNLNFYVRRGPMLTNFGYVLSTTKLEDDVSSDPFQIDARFVDFGLVSFAPSVLLFVSLAKAGALPPEWIQPINSFKSAAAIGLAFRLVIPFANILTLEELVRRLAFWRK